MYKRPQQLFLDHDTPRPSFHFSSPSSGSPQSPQQTLPWENLKHKTQHSYMNPTASSMAKSSRSSSLGEGIQGTGTPPCSPSFPKSKRLCGELEADPPQCPVSTASSHLSSPTSSHPTAAVIPNCSAQNIPPTRIPLPRQPLSPRRSLCLEVMPSSGSSGGPVRASTPTTDPGCDTTAAPGSQG